MFRATENDDIGIIQSLLDQGISAELVDKESGQTLLHHAAKLIVEKISDINVKIILVQLQYILLIL